MRIPNTRRYAPSSPRGRRNGLFGGRYLDMQPSNAARLSHRGRLTLIARQRLILSSSSPSGWSCRGFSSHLSIPSPSCTVYNNTRAARRTTTPLATPKSLLLRLRPHSSSTNTPATTTATMALQDEKHEWGAKRVRDTFLEYFNEKNGHTFGESATYPSFRPFLPRHL